MLIGAMMFGYMMSTIGSMVTTMDKQASLVEDKMDAVKEWMMSRNIPRQLNVRVRKYYEHFYTKRSAFDEEDIVRGLTPALRSEVTAILLRDSLGHFPLLELLGFEFQQEVYPRLKPLSYGNLDCIYARGELSDDIYFLRKGIVDVLAGGPGSNVLYRMNQGQYFGEEAITQERRGCTVLSNGWTELWSLSRDVIDETMDRFPHLQPKLAKFLGNELARKSRLSALSFRILITMAAREPERHSALIMQKAWTKFASLKARRDSRIMSGAPQTLKRQSGSARNVNILPPAREATPQAMQAALNEIQQQLVAIKREMKDTAPRQQPSSPTPQPQQQQRGSPSGFLSGSKGKRVKQLDA
jgi:CRP-like cAMP-binding protein